jgi:hypothetical protein
MQLYLGTLLITFVVAFNKSADAALLTLCFILGICLIAKWVKNNH